MESYEDISAYVDRSFTVNEILEVLLFMNSKYKYKGYSLKKYKVNMIISRRFQSLKNVDLEKEFQNDRNEFISMMMDNGYFTMVTVICKNGYFMIGYKGFLEETKIRGINCFKVYTKETLGWTLTFIRWPNFLRVIGCSELLDSVDIHGNEVKLWQAKETPEEITQKSSDPVYNSK